MIIKNGEVFQEDGSFRLQDLYVENHRIVASEDEVTDKTIVDAAGLRVIPGLVDYSEIRKESRNYFLLSYFHDIAGRRTEGNFCYY